MILQRIPECSCKTALLTPEILLFIMEYLDMFCQVPPCEGGKVTFCALNILDFFMYCFMMPCSNL